MKPVNKRMDSDEFRSILVNTRVDVWTLIETAITVASTDYEREFKRRRDAIVERLYLPVISQCRNCSGRHDQRPRRAEPDGCRHQSEANGRENNGRVVGVSHQPTIPLNRVDDDDHDGQRLILSIKERLEDINQSEDCLVDLLRGLAYMDITFKALKETDIGRHVNRLRKHSSNEVRRLVKLLIRKWKDVVDDWVRLNTRGEAATSLVGGDGDSPYQNHQMSTENGHSQRMEQDRARSYSEASTKAHELPPAFASHLPTPNSQRDAKEKPIDARKLDSATRRLHENYQDAQNAKKQRTIQVMDVQDIPRSKNTFFTENRGGVQAKQW